jgi:exopolysaccharide biosynthesis polyprenyl glycosylphosphotransferase
MDVRVRRELAHRRLAIALFRRALRLVTLHVLDAGMVLLSLWCAAMAWGRWVEARPFAPVVVASFLLSLNALSAYAPGEARRDRRRLASGALLAGLLLASLATFPPRLPFAPDMVAALCAAAFVALAAGRKAADLVVRQAYVRGYGLRRALLVGGLDEVASALRGLRDPRSVDQFVVGHVTRADRPDPASLGVLEELDRVLDEHAVQEVLVATPLPSDELRAMASACFARGVELYVIPAETGAGDYLAEPTRLGGCALLHLHPARLEMPSLAVKRLADVVLATVAILLLSPLLAVIALAIRLESPGPVFFLQQRVGLGGRLFTMWKFRSMATDAEARELELAHLNIYGNGTFKLRNDPRVTRVGRWLRRTSMDELPQLINVVLGDMSLVGPRPALVNDIKRYEPHHFERLSVVPGMTGPWQVGGRNLITDFDEILEMERRYISDWSLLVDAKIIAQTMAVVVRGDGAY